MALVNRVVDRASNDPNAFKPKIQIEKEDRIGKGTKDWRYVAQGWLLVAAGDTLGETVRHWSERHSEWPELKVLADIYEETFYRDKLLTAERQSALKQMLVELKERKRNYKPR